MQVLGLVITAHAGNSFEGIHMFSDESIVKKSGQTWKFWIFILLLFISVALIVPASTSWRSTEDVAFVLLPVGLVLGIANFVWLAVAIRCPNCKGSIGWHAMRKEEVNTWIHWLLRSDKCPVCEKK